MSYYNIDSILAEEELLPCTTLFDFSHLGHLDEYSTTAYLQEKSKFKMPFWALEKWASLGYVKVQLPRHFNIKTREKLEADPLALNLRKRNPHYFRSACRIISLLESSSDSAQDARALRQIILKTYTGVRLRTTLDWSWSGFDDDVSNYTEQLTEMERSLFRASVSGMGAHQHWKILGNRWNYNNRRRFRTVSPDVEEETLAKRQRIAAIQR